MDDEIPDFGNVGGGNEIPSGSLLVRAYSPMTDLEIDLYEVSALLIVLAAVSTLGRWLISNFFK